jgi:hypothetical protein
LKIKKKINIPKSVLDLRLTPKKFAKKHGIRLKGKGLTKGEKKREIKRFKKLYSVAAITGLNKAVKILSEHPPEGKKIEKVREAVDNVIVNPGVMKRVAKLYSKDPKNYPNMMLLPNFITTTILYYNQDTLNEKEKEEGKNLDKDQLLEFCEKILKTKIRRYRKSGLSSSTSYQLATVIPTTNLLKNNNRQWNKKLIQSLYTIAETESVDLNMILSSVRTIDKKKSIKKNEFYEGFFSEFMLSKSSNRNHTFNDTQKDLHDSLIEKTLEYLENIKPRKCREILKGYIKRRKTAESYKNDSKRVIKFIDHANSNSSYTNIKSVVQELISDNSTNELYLS